MSVAQRLYEGVDTPDGHVGLITYMRTDSTAIAGVAMGEARDVIRDRFGEPYTMPKGRVYKTKSKGAQEAHESIRPTIVPARPGLAGGARSKPEELRLYRLIWQRALASQMAAKELETTTAELAAGAVRAAGERDADAVRRLLGRSTPRAATTAPRTRRSGACRRSPRATSRPSSDVTPTQHFTEPPPRFTEATLIKALEEHGIGRPSTYAATISTIVDRGYVRVEERRLHPELVGEIVTDLLVEHFGDYVDVEFTARMEEELDEVARGERAWVPLLQAFYAPLRDRVDEKSARTSRRARLHDRGDRRGLLAGPPDGHPARPERPVPGLLALPGAQGIAAAARRRGRRPRPGEGETCPQCGEGTLVGKRGQFGPFVGCSRYPDCTYIKKEGPPPPDPLAVRGRLPEERRRARSSPRRARRTGNVFWGCSNYPKCDYTTNFEPVGALHDTDDGPGREERRGRDLPEVRRAIVPLAGRRDARRRAARRRAAEPGGARPAGPRRRPGRGRPAAAAGGASAAARGATGGRGAGARTDRDRTRRTEGAPDA